MVKIGIAVCVVGSIIAILFPPVELFGFGGGWHFLLEDQGFGTHTYNFIDTGTLLIELLIINGVGLGLFFFGRRRAGGQ